MNTKPKNRRFLAQKLENRFKKIKWLISRNRNSQCRPQLREAYSAWAPGYEIMRLPGVQDPIVYLSLSGGPFKNFFLRWIVFLPGRAYTSLGMQAFSICSTHQSWRYSLGHLLVSHQAPSEFETKMALAWSKCARTSKYACIACRRRRLHKPWLQIHTIR